MKMSITKLLVRITLIWNRPTCDFQRIRTIMLSFKAHTSSIIVMLRCLVPTKAAPVCKHGSTAASEHNYACAWLPHGCVEMTCGKSSTMFLTFNFNISPTLLFMRVLLVAILNLKSYLLHEYC